MDRLLSAKDAAAVLGITTSTWYAWLSQSNAGTFEICGEAFTID